MCLFSLLTSAIFYDLFSRFSRSGKRFESDCSFKPWPRQVGCGRRVLVRPLNANLDHGSDLIIRGGSLAADKLRCGPDGEQSPARYLQESNAQSRVLIPKFVEVYVCRDWLRVI